MKAEHSSAVPPKPPTPVPAPARDRESGSGKEKLAPPATARRGEGDRLRTLWSNRGAEVLPTVDGQYFAQLIGLVDEGGGQQGWGGGAIAMTTQSEEVPMDLMDELTKHLSKNPMSTLEVTLLMPNLGRIEVRANVRGGRWEVELGFARRDVLRRLQPRQGSCEAALTDALGQPVELSMLDEACA
jgi:hypothetical protein